VTRERSDTKTEEVTHRIPETRIVVQGPPTKNDNNLPPTDTIEISDTKIEDGEIIQSVPELYFSHTMSETEVGILTLTSEYDVINPTINMAGMASSSLPAIDYCGCSTRLITLLNTDRVFRSVLFWCRYIYWNCYRNTSISLNAKGCY
jgi:hypothetical protein